MVLSTAVPQNIINAIVDDLHDDQGALKQCAVTSRAFVEPAQRYLFSIIHLTHQYYVLSLSEVFKGRPTIASYVQELYVGDAASALQDSDSPFPYLLAAVNNLKVFSCEVDSEAGFIEKGDGDFKTFPPAVQSAFLDVVKSTHLLTLRLNNVKNLPYDIFTGSSVGICELSMIGHLRS
ncbi:hypothetical protein Hypma_012529 [Hypsizygus marmoreus]|uniref:F-box domain-containing protein n=1 Tax=Hypsizygus marmoreus TaxID=39966 RepID=A0A369JGR2_HYPMA|nr:hypothetical protein Hypma_012529 [Hypsizygus marmoreus]